MMACIRDCLMRNLLTMVIVAAIMAILAGIIAATGGLVIAIASLTIGVTQSAIIAGLLVFGAVVALYVVGCVATCAAATNPPQTDPNDSVADAATSDDRETSDPPGWLGAIFNFVFGR